MRTLAEKRNELVLQMRDNPNLTQPTSQVRKEFDEIYSKMVKIENSLIKTHIEDLIGKIEYTEYIDDDEVLPFYIYQIHQLKNKNYGVLLTSGFSLLPLAVPQELNFRFNYLEFAITIPSDFPLPVKNQKNYEFYWLIEKLRFFISYLHRDKTFFCDGHTYGNGNPPKPLTTNTEICGFLFKFPFETLPSSFCELNIPSIN
ncbi:MAG: hypothetical protein BAJALOKI1v1_190002 [Promethearchaeota archaeon]|nr:MAG: hypothetical protein BAJALOKI1v1_190002 [Candidatus Lokiarchaeota archaeon]